MKKVSGKKIITCLAVLGIVFLFMLQAYQKRLLRIRDELIELYGNSLSTISYDARKNFFQVLVDLPFQSFRAPEIKKELEEKYGKQIKIRLCNHSEEESGFNSLLIPAEDYTDHLHLVLDHSLYKSCKILSLGNIEKALENCNKNTSDTEQVISEIIQSNLDLYSRIIPLDRQTVKEGDLCKIHVNIRTAEKTVAVLEKETANCLLSPPYSFWLGEQTAALLGSTVGETFTVSCPESMWQWLGLTETPLEQLLCDVTVLFIYVVEKPCLNDAFVQEHTAYNTIEAWKNALRNELESQNLHSLGDSFIKAMTADSEFEAEPGCLKELAEKLLDSTHAEAALYGISEKEYISLTYGQSAEEYILESCQTCSQEIKEYLIIQALTDYYSLSVTEEEARQAYAAEGLSYDSLCETDKAYYLFCTLKEKLLHRLFEV